MLSDAELSSLLAKVRRPSRYIGGEINSARKDWDAAHQRWCLVFPDVYEIGMSHIGLQIIYDILNKEEGCLADRCFAPWVDMEAVMRELREPLWGLETRRSLKEFDVIGITLPYELTYTNILTILELAGIPFYSAERDENFPLIIGGGVGAFNPEPVAPFFDAILLGDGERAVGEISRVVGRLSSVVGNKQELLCELAKIRGVYVPGKFEVKKAIVSDINKVPYPTKWVVPYMNVVHDRVGIEIQRGCVRGCRFCQAGFIYRPLRQRTVGKIEELSECGLKATGHEDISFLSLSAGDHKDLPNVLKDMAEKYADNWVNISLPSLRVETLTSDMLSVMQRSLHGGFTLAPEAGTERLRKVVNKGNTENDLLKTIEKVFETGWRQLKLYFMIGLPTETEDDVKAIAELSHKALNIGKKYRRDASITISISTFVPKPHTPFQWAGQISMDETKTKQDLLKNLLRRRGLELKWHDARLSFLEGVFSRGGRELAPVIHEAWKNGARFDAWDEQLRFDVWMKAFETCNLKPETFLAERPLDGKLPWEHIFAELDKDFLQAEFKRALNEETLPDCLNNKCTHCGVCDFKEIKNVTVSHCEAVNAGEAIPLVQGIATPPSAARNDSTIRFLYNKTDTARWLSHLELMQVLRRALRRAEIPAAYSQGFHPHMKLSLQPARKVGEEASCDAGAIELKEPMDIEKFFDAVNQNLPEGVRIRKN